MQVMVRTQQAVEQGGVTVAAPDALNLLEQFGTTVHLDRDEELHAEGDDAEYCYRVVSGCLRTVQLLEDGRRQVAEFFLRGDLIGIDALDIHDFAAEAVTEAVVRRYPRRMVDALAESRPVLALRLGDMARRSLRAAQIRIVLLGRKTACERIATFLLEMDRRLHVKGAFIAMPMCRTDIADHLGLTVETVCRVLAQMKKDGVVALARNGVELRNRVAVESLASGTRH